MSNKLIKIAHNGYKIDQRKLSVCKASPVLKKHQ